jgi:hypothetical protein
MGDDSGIFTTGEKISQIRYLTLVGTVTTNTTSGTITGSGTEFSTGLTAGDELFIYDSASQLQSIRTIDTITNSSVLQLTSNNSFTASYATIAKVHKLASGYKTGNSSPYITLSNTEPKFVVGSRIIGHTSGAFANVTAINVNEKNYNSWNTFDNRIRIAYTSNTSGFSNDAIVYQGDISLANARFHSANSTYLFLTSDKGPITANPSSGLNQYQGVAGYTLGSIKYNSDIVKNSGEVIYIENSEPITRANAQSESFKVVLQF